jgi:hypothetical protein
MLREELEDPEGAGRFRSMSPHSWRRLPNIESRSSKRREKSFQSKPFPPGFPENPRMPGARKRPPERP